MLRVDYISPKNIYLAAEETDYYSRLELPRCLVAPLPVRSPLSMCHRYSSYSRAPWLLSGRAGAHLDGAIVLKDSSIR